MVTSGFFSCPDLEWLVWSYLPSVIHQACLRLRTEGILTMCDQRFPTWQFLLFLCSFSSPVCLPTGAPAQEPAAPKRAAAVPAADDDIPPPFNRQVPIPVPRIRLQPARPLPPGANRQVPMNGGFPQREADPSAPEFATSRRGPRRIRVDLPDEKLEILDGAGPRITMKRTRMVEGKPQVTEVKAENLTELQQSRPDLCRLYEKYTGLKADLSPPQ